MTEPETNVTVPQETRKPIRWRIVLGLIIVLFSFLGLGNPKNREGAIIVLILGGAVFGSGLPIRQPRWWALVLGAIALQGLVEVAFAGNAGGIIILGVLTAILLLLGLQPVIVDKSK